MNLQDALQKKMEKRKKKEAKDKAKQDAGICTAETSLHALTYDLHFETASPSLSRDK